MAELKEARRTPETEKRPGTGMERPSNASGQQPPSSSFGRDSAAR